MVDPRKPSRRLTLQDAVEIWLHRWKGHLQHHIAAHFGVNQGRISEVLSRKIHPEAFDKAKAIK